MDFTWIIYMFLLMIVGFAAGKAKFIDEAGRVALTSLLFNISYPVLVIDSITRLNLRELAEPSVIVIVSTLVTMLVFYFVGRILIKRVKDDNKKPIALFAMAAGNITFVTMPVIEHFFGEVGVYYTVLFSSAQDVLIWTIYYMYFVGRGKGIPLKKLLTPISVSLAAAILMAALGIRPSGAFEKLLTSLGGITVPVALVYVGATIAASGVQEWKPDRLTLFISVVKVFIAPCAFFCVSLPMRMDPQLRVIITVMLASPVAVMTTVWAKQYDCDELFAIKLLLFSTLLFFAAVPIFFLR